LFCLLGVFVIKVEDALNEAFKTITGYETPKPVVVILHFVFGGRVADSETKHITSILPIECLEETIPITAGAVDDVVRYLNCVTPPNQGISSTDELASVLCVVGSIF
jgi:hypothetical protein